MTEVRKGYYYTKEHEWISVEENIVTIGITDYAQKSLGDIVFVDIPKVDEEVRKDESFGVVESVKAVSDLYTPISGKVVEINETLKNSPELVNEDPYENGWMIKVEVPSESEIKKIVTDELMDSTSYKEFLAEEE